MINNKNYRHMKKMLFAAVIVAVAGMQSAMAQEMDESKMQEMMTKFITAQTEVIARSLQLTDEQTTDFKTLYTEYKTKEMALMKPGNGAKAGKKARGERPKMTDARADSLMKASIEKEESRLSLKKEYYSKLKDKIGAAKAYQALNYRPRMNRQGNNNFGGRGGNGGRGFGGGQRGGSFGGPGNMGGGDF